MESLTDSDDIVFLGSIPEQVYQASVATFLPTPVKSHYLFNMRDVAKVIEGVMQVQHAFSWISPRKNAHRQPCLNEY